ncbi:MAG: hypothetical protein FJ109_07945 [Deltaproteobacteria bacterium]|nr:hypothetical protein [Deltaproteobacteria bacterium]
MKRFCPKCLDEFEQPEGGCPKCGGELVTLPDETLVGQVLDDRYSILGIVGRGGMGVVYRARQKYLDRDVAVKVLRRDMSADATNVKRFLLEARAASALRSPHTVTIHDFGITRDGQLYFVMELLEGQPLSRLVRKGPMEPERVVRLVAQAAASLAEAHGKGIWHRDIKPENLFVAQDEEGEETLKVLDFGIARIADSGTHLTARGMVCGTPQYVSPEQAQGKPLDQRTDIYSLAVVAYEMLAGRPPFEGETPVQVLIAHVKSAPPPLAEVRPGPPVAPSLWRVLRWALEKDPEARPASAELFASALRQAVSDPGYAPDTAADAETRRLAPGRPGRPGPIAPQAHRSDRADAEHRFDPTEEPGTRRDYPMHDAGRDSHRPSGLQVADGGTAVYGAEAVRQAPSDTSGHPSSAPDVSTDVAFSDQRRTRALWGGGLGLGLLLLALFLVYRPWQGAAPEPVGSRVGAESAGSAEGPRPGMSTGADAESAATPPAAGPGAEVDAPGSGPARHADQDAQAVPPGPVQPDGPSPPTASGPDAASLRGPEPVPRANADAWPVLNDAVSASEGGSPSAGDVVSSEPVETVAEKGKGTGKGKGKGKETATKTATATATATATETATKTVTVTEPQGESGEYFLIAPDARGAGEGTGPDSTRGVGDGQRDAGSAVGTGKEKDEYIELE